MSLSSCFSSSKNITWREETKLANGQMVIVEQSIDFRSAFNGAGTGWTAVDSRLKVVLPPKNQEVVWDGRLLAPIALDVATNGDIYLVAIAEAEEDRQKYSLSRGLYHVAFKYKGNGEWTHIPLDAVPHEMQANLFTDPGGYFIGAKHSTEGVLDWAFKEQDKNSLPAGNIAKGWRTK